jgi:hypothetical protein
MFHPQNRFLEASRIPPLGTTAKFPSAFNLQSQTGQEKRFSENAENRGEIDPETGEILGPVRAFDSMVAKCDRFILQSVVRRLMGSSRTAKCLRFRQSRHDVQVFRSLEYRSASYGGLQTCGSVWACPVCAAKIAERRRVEIQTAMAAHVAVGGNFALLTLTIPHQVVDVLPDLLQKLASAKARFLGHRAVRRVLGEMGFVGQISALEVTHGRKSGRNNGWHPHPHILLFTRYGGGIDPHWTSALYVLWSAACQSVGLGLPSRAHGIRLDDGRKAAAYVSKWGLEDEITKGHTKKSAHGETPFDFLRAIVADSGDKQAARLFVEFARAFKGKQQLLWSRGLKELYRVEETSDEDLAGKQDELAALLGTIGEHEWRQVLRAEARGIVLMLAVAGGWDAVRMYLDGLLESSQTAV